MLLLLQVFLAAALPVAAQVENQNQPTVLDATWTEAQSSEASSDGDLHLSGQSTVDYTVKNTSNNSGNYTYRTTIEVRNSAGQTKAVKYYKCAHTWGGTETWTVSDDNSTYTYLGTGQTVNGSLSLPNGATGDYLYMSISLISGSGSVSVILTVLTSTSTRYDLYDHLPLFGTDTGATPTSNRIKDHNQIIDVYVHRTIVGNGTWGTLCLPFDMTDAQVKKSLGDDVVYSEFRDVDLTRKHINFASTHGGMQAGKPYLIQNNGTTIDNFFADDVTFTQASVQAANNDRKSAVESNGYYFVGLLEPTQVNTAEPTYNPGGRAVYIANPDADGKQELKRLSATGTIKAFRAYLVFPQASAGAKPSDMMIALDEMLDTPTAIGEVRVDGQTVSNRIYDLSGRYVGSDVSRLSKGVYVRDGKKFMKQ